MLEKLALLVDVKTPFKVVVPLIEAFPPTLKLPALVIFDILYINSSYIKITPSKQ
jgi:hypothetical protein